MTKVFARATLLSVALVAFGFLVLAPQAESEILPLRSGTVVSKVDIDVYTYIKAVDAEGKEFWIMTSICTIGEKGKIAVLAGAHYNKIKSGHLNTVLDDVYTALLLRIGDQEVKGFGAHMLPEGCVMLK